MPAAAEEPSSPARRESPRKKKSDGAAAEADWLWYNLATPPRLGLAAPVKTLLKRAAAELNAGETS